MPPTRNAKAATEDAPAAGGTRRTGGSSRRPSAGRERASANGGVDGVGVGAKAERQESSSSKPKSKTEKVLERDSVRPRLPLLGQLTLPPPAHLAWYAGVSALAVAEIIEWPVAVVLGIGKALADNRHNSALRELGESLEEGG